MNACRNNGACHDLTSSYVCDCTSGYSGPQCQHARGRLRLFVRNAISHSAKWTINFHHLMYTWLPICSMTPTDTNTGILMLLEGPKILSGTIQWTLVLESDLDSTSLSRIGNGVLILLSPSGIPIFSTRTPLRNLWRWKHTVAMYCLTTTLK